MFYSEDWVNLRHFTERGCAIAAFEMNRHLAHVQFKRDFFRAGFAPQCECGPQCGMAGEGKLLLHRKDAHANPLIAFRLGIAG